MSGIYIAALITFALSLAVYGGALAWNSPREERRFLVVALALQLPMSVLTYYRARLPMADLADWFFHGAPVLKWITVLYAPLTEEPAKLWPLLLPWFARRVTRDNAVRVAVALGLGFGLGEVVLVARFVAANPKIASLPWYQLGGFINERFLVCLMHGVFVATALCAWRRWRGGFASGFIGAMTLHLLGNLPIFLAQLGTFGSNKSATNLLLGLWVPAYWLAMLTLLAFYSTGGWKVGQFIFGDATCPACGQIYPRPLLALNLGAKRLERCPHCKKWHKV